MRRNSTPQCNVNDIIQEGLATERNRVTEINAIGAKFGVNQEAERFIATGKSVQEFRAHVLSKTPDALLSSLEKAPDTQAAEAGEAVALIKERRKAHRTG